MIPRRSDNVNPIANSDPLKDEYSDLDFGGYQSVVQPPDSVFMSKFQKFTRSSIAYDFGNGEVYPFVMQCEVISGTTMVRTKGVYTGEWETLTPGDTVWYWLIHQVVRESLAKADPKIGERIAIKYYGKQLTRDAELRGITLEKANGKDAYHRTAVKFLDRPDPDVSVSASELFLG